MAARRARPTGKFGQAVPRYTPRMCPLARRHAARMNVFWSTVSIPCCTTSPPRTCSPRRTCRRLEQIVSRPKPASLPSVSPCGTLTRRCLPAGLRGREPADDTSMAGLDRVGVDTHSDTSSGTQRSHAASAPDPPGRSSPADGQPPVASGRDILIVRDGKITSLIASHSTAHLRRHRTRTPQRRRKTVCRSGAGRSILPDRG